VHGPLRTLQLKVRFTCAITINVMKWGGGGPAGTKIQVFSIGL